MDMRMYWVIYDATHHEVGGGGGGMLAPKFREVDLGRAECACVPKYRKWVWCRLLQSWMAKMQAQRPDAPPPDKILSFTTGPSLLQLSRDSVERGGWATSGITFEKFHISWRAIL